MSYSFSVSGKTKDETKTAVATQFELIVSQQPMHGVDAATAQAAVYSFIDLASDPTGEQAIHVSVYGSITQGPEITPQEGEADGGEVQPTNVAAVSINMSLSVV